MGSGSQSRQAARDLEQAEIERLRRTDDGLQFASVRHALGFLFERGPSMQTALGRHPRGHQAADGSTVVLSVDGGRGGSIDDVLATLQTIHDALHQLKMHDPVAHELLVLHVRDGHSMVELGKRSGLAPSTCSAKIGQGQYFLLGRLAGGVVIARPA